MDYGNFSDALRRLWWLVLLLVVIGLAGAFFYARGATPQFVSRADVVIAVNAQDASALNSGSSFAQQQARNLSVLATRPQVISPVVQRLGLDESSAGLARHITATVPSNTSIITLEVTYPSGDGATAIANAMADSLAQTAAKVLPVPESDGTTVNVRPIYQDAPPTSPSSTNQPVALAAGAIAGLAAGLVLTALVSAATSARRRRASPPAPDEQPDEAARVVTA